MWVAGFALTLSPYSAIVPKQNKQFRDAVRDAGGLTKEQQQRLHREIGKENWGYHEIRQRVIEIKKGM